MDKPQTQVVFIREGTEQDIPQVLKLIHELAVFEREPNAVKTSIDSMLKDGFGAQPVFGMFVAEVQSTIVGASIYYYRYSTWRGRCLYLEDLIVTESYRGQGIGQQLFSRIVRKAKEDECQGISWQVLNWNQPALDFYGKYGAKSEAQWLNCSLSREQIENFQS